jgi:hypothetical protein
LERRKSLAPTGNRNLNLKKAFDITLNFDIEIKKNTTVIYKNPWPVSVHNFGITL